MTARWLATPPLSWATVLDKPVVVNPIGRAAGEGFHFISPVVESSVALKRQLASQLLRTSWKACDRADTESRAALRLIVRALGFEVALAQPEPPRIPDHVRAENELNDAAPTVLPTIPSAQERQERPATARSASLPIGHD